MTRGRLLAGVALTAGIFTLVLARSASAHPLGDFTVNQHSGLVISPSRVTLELVVDMAEIPTFQTRPEIDADRDNAVSPGEAAAYRQRTCTRLSEGLDVRADGQPLPFAITSSDLSFPPGQAGLATLRLTCDLTASSAHGPIGRIEFANRNFTNRVGWREITAVGDGVRLAASDVATRSRSAVLTNYPEDLLSSPLDQRQAHLRLGTVGDASGDLAASVVGSHNPAGPSTASGGRGVDRFTAAFTGLVGRQRLTHGFGLLALLAAVALGAVHALAPGHGKTVMAAYLLGERGSLRQASLLGLTVTSTHTAGVLVLGFFISGSTAIVPEAVYPWLGVTSGAMLAGVGVSLLVRACHRRSGGLTAFAAHQHHHGGSHHDRHGHGHHEPGHHHDEHHHHVSLPAHLESDEAQPPMSHRALMIMGAAGGMVPSPSALVVLLGAIALGRTWFGIALVLGYGIGMALTLVGAGLLMVRARASLDGRLRSGTRMARVAQALPVMTASFVTVAGVGLAARAFNQM